MLIKVLAFSFIALMFNGWYSDIKFRGDVGEGDLISTEIVELDTQTRLGRKVIAYSGGGLTRVGVDTYPIGLEKLSGQSGVKGIIYYSTKCYRAGSPNNPRKRCDTFKVSKDSFNLLWNRVPLEVVYAKSDTDSK